MNEKARSVRLHTVCAWCYPKHDSPIERNKNAKVSHGCCEWHLNFCYRYPIKLELQRQIAKRTAELTARNVCAN